MELNPIGVFAILGGVILLYSAVKNTWPQDVIRQALGKPALKGPIMSTGQARRIDTPTTPAPSTGTIIATV